VHESIVELLGMNDRLIDDLGELDLKNSYMQLTGHVRLLVVVDLVAGSFVAAIEV
jgi:hypothetical protein